MGCLLQTEENAMSSTRKTPFAVGDRVRGRFTGRIGTVTSVWPMGIYVKFDGDNFEYPAMLEPLAMEKL
jgi:hypothetical protein